MTVVFAGGGTGGHLYPAIAIAEELRRAGTRVAFVGSADRLETSIVPASGFELHAIAAHALPRRPSLGLPRAALHNAAGTLQSLRLLGRLRPDLVIATGGYVCFPVVLAARIRRWAGLSAAPIALLEPNAAPGLTARMLAPIADEIWGECGGFAPRARRKCRPTGVPVRYRRDALPPRAQAALRLGLDPLRPALLVLGGSQGARSLNDAVAGAAAAGRLPAGWQALLLTGRAEYERVRAATAGAPGVVVRPYLDAMEDAYAVADLVVARAGASTLAELAELEKPALLIPYPHAAEAHQAGNAARAEAGGGAVVMCDAELSAGALPEALAAVTAPPRLAQLRAAARRSAGPSACEAVLARVAVLLRGKSER